MPPRTHRMHRAWSLAALLLAFDAMAAAPADAGMAAWLDSPAAREFRTRVAQLAVLYGESSGIDPSGLRVTAARIGEARGDCARVEIAVRAAGQEVRREEQGVCVHAGAGPH